MRKAADSVARRTTPGDPPWTPGELHDFVLHVPRDEPFSDAAYGNGAVPLTEVCPACGAPVEGQKCKVYCPNDACVLFRRIIENCAGD